MVIAKKEMSDEDIQRAIEDGNQEAFYEPLGMELMTRWIKMECKFPADAAHVIHDEFSRIEGLLQLKPGIPEKVKLGLILEYICINSALTPLESLE